MEKSFLVRLEMERKNLHRYYKVFEKVGFKSFISGDLSYRRRTLPSISSIENDFI